MNEISKNTKVSRKIFLPSDYEKEENYLCQMSKEGWHLKKIKKGFGIGKFYFEKGEIKNYSYAIQYIIKDQNTENYCKSIEDKGWINIAIIPYLWNGEWHYFRKESIDDEKYENLTDKESKLGLLKNILRSLWIIGLCLIFSGVSIVSNSFETLLGYPDARFSMPFATIILLAYGIVLGVYMLILVPLVRKILQLSKEN